jgi:hypothetical protein
VERWPGQSTGGSPIAGGRSSLAIEGVPRPVEQAPRLLAAIADSREADQPVPAERRHHVEDDPSLRRVVEVESIANGEVEDVVRLQHSVRIGLEPIGGHEELRLPGRRHEERTLGVVGAVREELQRQVRVSRAALAQVQLDRVPLPSTLRLGSEKVDREPADDAAPGERFADLPRLLRDLARILVARREDGAEEAQPARAAELLVVRRELLDLPERRHAHLYAWAAELRPHDELLDDAAVGEALQESLGAHVGVLRA